MKDYKIDKRKVITCSTCKHFNNPIFCNICKDISLWERKPTSPDKPSIPNNS